MRIDSYPVAELHDSGTGDEYDDLELFTLRYLLPSKPTDCRATAAASGDSDDRHHEHRGDDMAYLTCMVGRAVRKPAAAPINPEEAAVLAGVYQHLAGMLQVQGAVTGPDDTQGAEPSLLNSQVAMYTYSQSM